MLRPLNKVTTGVNVSRIVLRALLPKYISLIINVEEKNHSVFEAYIFSRKKMLPECMQSSVSKKLDFTIFQGDDVAAFAGVCALTAIASAHTSIVKC